MNEGEAEEMINVTFDIDGKTVDSQEEIVAPSETETVSSSLTFNEAGTYTISVGDTSTDIDVTATTDTTGGDQVPGFGGFCRDDSSSHRSLCTSSDMTAIR